MNSLKDLHETLIREITDERNQEMARLIAEKRQQEEQAKERYRKGMESVAAMGIDVSRLEAMNLELSALDEKELLEAEAQMEQLSQESPVIEQPDPESALVPEGVQLLQPSWVGAFSDDDARDELTEASAPSSQTLLTGSCKNYFNWAKGAGTGLFGTGVGKNQSWVDFGFWFRPRVTRYYAIRPLFRLRGYVIVKANDGVFTSKYAKVKAVARVNVHQYNWKGENEVSLYSIGGDNINRNQRMDIDRHTYNSYLLARDDWAFIRCTIGLYAYARGSGSHARNDFSTGAANHLCVPHCHVL